MWACSASHRKFSAGPLIDLVATKQLHRVVDQFWPARVIAGVLALRARTATDVYEHPRPTRPRLFPAQTLVQFLDCSRKVSTDHHVIYADDRIVRPPIDRTKRRVDRDASGDRG